MKGFLLSQIKTKSFPLGCFCLFGFGIDISAFISEKEGFACLTV